MRILINTLTAQRRKTGIGHYVNELLRCLTAHDDELDITQYPGPRVQRLLQRPRRSSPKSPANGKQRSSPWIGTLGRRLTAWHFRLDAALRTFDLYHEPNFIPLPCARPTVATLLDLSVVLHPQWHPSDRVRHFEKHLHHGLARCAHFFAISDTCRQELVDHLGIPADKITRTYMGVRSDFRPLPDSNVQAVVRRLGLPENFLLFVGTLEPRKNLLLLMQAYCALPAELRQRCPLLLVGGWGWNTQELMAYYHDEARHHGVMHLGYLADDDLPALYNAARALVFPSHYEGFGLPPLEMLACGGAVIASTAAAIRETVGAKACLIDSHDRDAWRLALRKVILDDDWRKQLRVGAVAVARPFTWENCAAETLRVYRQIAQCEQVPRTADAGTVPV